MVKFTHVHKIPYNSYIIQVITKQFIFAILFKNKTVLAKIFWW